MEQAQQVLERIFGEGVTRLPVMERMRLRVTLSGDTRCNKKGLSWHALNEVNIYRGPSPTLTRISCHVDGSLFTNAVSDG